MAELSDFLKQANEQSIEAFKGQKRILSFVHRCTAGMRGLAPPWESGYGK